MEGAIGVLKSSKAAERPASGDPHPRVYRSGAPGAPVRVVDTQSEPAPVPDVPPLEPTTPRDSVWRDRTRRVLNVLVALIGIILTLPLMAAIAVAIRVTSRGPVIFRQQRVGLDRRQVARGPVEERRVADAGGRIFTMYKFRTMYHRRAKREVWARPGDPRITPVGRILRAYRLDELPQLFNVLRGDMNVVGPRPEQPKIFSNLADRFGAYRARQRVLPGITGMAQVQLPYDQSLEDVRKKVDKDLEYIEKRGLWTDFKIMLRTIKVLCFKRGSL